MTNVRTFRNINKADEVIYSVKNLSKLRKIKIILKDLCEYGTDDLKKNFK